MSFSSIHFIFIFLPLTLVLYYLLRNWKWRNGVLVVASILFYAWADPKHVHLLFITVFINYAAGLWIESRHNAEKPAAAKRVMWATVVLNLLILAFYRYTGIAIETLQQWTHLTINFSEPKLPIGISYFTFSGLSYILDVYQRVEPAQRNLLGFGSYVVMFPKILQGPITRFSQVKKELLTTDFNYDEILEGVRRFITGLAKKVIIADNLAIAARKVLSSDFDSVGAGVAWFGLIAYTLQIYFDFSGYTDIAIGLGKMLGLKLPENFNYPYISRSITEFWRRWHMTLINWFRTYVFIPLEFSRKKAKHLRQQTNILIVFLLTGLWHSASLNFITWGAYFGVILAIEASGLGKKIKTWPCALQHFYSLILIMFGWIFFRQGDVSTWGPLFKALFGGNGWAAETTLRNLNVLFFIPLILVAIFLSIPWFKQSVDRLVVRYSIARVVIDVLYLGLFVLTVGFILSNGYAAFMYGEF